MINVSHPVEALHAVAEAERTGTRARMRVEDAAGLVAGELRRVQADLDQMLQRGPAPGGLAARHLLAAGGKRIRPLLGLLAGALVSARVGAGLVLTVATVAELIHLATLMHDDVIDDADERRGKPAARRVWGNAVSVLGGDWLLVEALSCARTLPEPCFGELLSTLNQLVCGEIVQLRGRTMLELSASHYEQVIEGKTASLFAWVAAAGAGVSGGSAFDVENARAFGHHIGLCFQLVDDLLDYAGNADDTGKRLLRDLEEGKATLPLVLAAANDPRVAVLLGQIRDGDNAAVLPLAQIVRASDACARVRLRAEHEAITALDALRRFQPSAARDILEQVTLDLVGRVA